MHVSVGVSVDPSPVAPALLSVEEVEKCPDTSDASQLGDRVPTG
nr:hypothetical protein [Stenomitos frigidus]